MIKVENIEVFNFEGAVRGARNPMNSWSRSDSHMETDYANNTTKFVIGENDLDLMKRLYKAGPEHRKYLRQIFVSMDITAPMYWWKEMDQYRINVTTNGCSTMHKLHTKEFTPDDFSHEHLFSEYNQKENHEIEFDENEAELKIIKDYPDYKVSENGVVYSFKTGEKKKLSPRIDIDGYKTVGLYNNGKVKRFKIHRLVASAFIPNDNEAKDCINHIDGNKWNNTVGNLEWCTRKENSLHASRTGLLITGSKQKLGMARKRRFSQEQIMNIKNLYESGMTQRKLGEMFGCDHSVISEIVNNKIYKDITIFPLELLEIMIDDLNELREKYIETNDKKYWYAMIQLLPSSYNQKRTITMNYENVVTIIKQRSGHKLDEWNTFVDILKDLPYIKEIING